MTVPTHAAHVEDDRSMATLPTLDPEVFYELRDSVAQKPGALSSIYATFFINAVRLIGAVAAAESVETRQQSLHALKGSAAMMGAARMARLAGDLEKACATMSANSRRSAVAQLQLELEAVRRDADPLLRAAAR